MYTFENGFDKELILTEILQIYRNFKNKEIVKEQMKILLNELYKTQLDLLQTFNIFDLFESSENVKSKTSEILIFSFYQDLLKDISIDPENTVIEIFKLFEKYLPSSKDKAFLFKNSSFESLKELTEINKRFIYAKTNQINNLIKQKKGFFKHYLQKIHKEELIFFIILISLSVVKILAGSTQKSQNNSPYVAPFARRGSPTYTILRSSLEAPQSVSHINMTLQTPEFHGTLRAKMQKITYTAPKVQPISSGTTKVGSPKNSPIKNLKTAPAPLLLQTESQTSQEVAKLQNRVNRNLSNTTQIVVNQVPTATNSGVQTKTHLLNLIQT